MFESLMRSDNNVEQPLQNKGYNKLQLSEKIEQLLGSISISGEILVKKD